MFKRFLFLFISMLCLALELSAQEADSADVFAMANPNQETIISPVVDSALLNRFNNYYKGIDVSKYQFNISWSELDTSLQFVICKATEGTTHIDHKFKSNWDNIDTRYKRGAYHFFRPDKSGKEQAALFLSTVNFGCGDILPVIDVEYTRSYRRTNPRITAANLHKMIAEIEKVLGVKPIIYTNARFWSKYIDPYFKYNEKDFYLWTADYRLNEYPGIHKDWEDWTLWQHSDKGCVSGINCAVDLNVCKRPLDEIIIK